MVVLSIAIMGFHHLDVEYYLTAPRGLSPRPQQNYTFVWRNGQSKRNRTRLLNKVRILLEQVDGSHCTQENSVKDTSVEFTPSMLSNIVDELKEVLEHQPVTQDKKQKKALREKEETGQGT